MLSDKRVTGKSFAARLAKLLHLKPHETREMKLHAAPGKLILHIGKAEDPNDPSSRSVTVTGSIYLSGIHYEIHIQDKMGKGKLNADDHAALFDRSAQIYLHSNHAAQVYESLIPFLEMGVECLVEEE